jgi:hypothetical protein
MSENSSKQMSELGQSLWYDNERGLLQEEHIERLIINHTRRLQVLEQRKALLGWDAPPHISLEMEDIKATIERLRMELQRGTGDGELQ